MDFLLGIIRESCFLMILHDIRVSSYFSEILGVPWRFWGNWGTVGVPSDFLAILEDYKVREMIHPYKELGIFLSLECKINRVLKS